MRLSKNIFVDQERRVELLLSANQSSVEEGGKKNKIKLFCGAGGIFGSQCDRYNYCSHTAFLFVLQWQRRGHLAGPAQASSKRCCQDYRMQNTSFSGFHF